MSNTDPSAMPKDIERYGNLLTLAANPAAASGEVANALNHLRRMEDKDPSIRIRFAEYKVENPTPAAPQAAPDPFGDFLTDQLGALFGEARSALSSNVPQATATIVAAVEELLGTAKTAITPGTSSMDIDTSDIDLGGIKWGKEVTTPDQVAGAYEKMVRTDEDFGIVDGDDPSEGDLAQIYIQIPVGMLVQVAKNAKLSHEFVGQLIVDLLDDGEDDDDDGEVEEVEPPSRFARGARSRMS